MKSKYIFSALLCATLLTSCGGGGGDDTPPPVTPPSAATLVFPDNNEECTEGVVVSSTQSEVTFDWSDAANTDNYTLRIKNLLTNSTTTHNATASEFTATILRGTPYSWNVISKATGATQTAESATWKFYNAGEGVENYAPFPAEAASPKMGENLDALGGQITLSWNASDLDDDLVNYDVYFGTDATTSNLENTVTTTTLNVSVTSGTAYYWRIVSRDSEGNTSNSEIFQFKIN